MIRYILLALPLISFEASAAVRRLAADCTLPGQAPTESQPFDLDACAIQDGDDITQLLTDIRSQWPGGFYVRAPSKTVNVISNTIFWPSSTKVYAFLEDQDASNRMVIQHARSPSDFYRLWKFENFKTVKLGGPKLSLTFRGNHPGLANCDVQQQILLAEGYTSSTAANCDANRGLVEFRMSDGTMADLADVRANFRFAQHYSIYTFGSTAEGGTEDKIYQFNVAGVHFATSGIFFHQGVKHAWADPERTLVTDPYVRVWGWTGVTPGQKQGGLLMGCNDPAKDQPRGAIFNGYYADSITGGVTAEYGAEDFTQRYVGRVGVSTTEPFVLRIKDWMVSGPGTGYTAGVRVKKTGDAVLMKGDPHDTGSSSAAVRFIKYEKLPSAYGDGPGTDYLYGCSPSNQQNDGPSNLVRLESNVSGRANRGWHVTFAGDWNSNFIRGSLFRFAFDTDTDRTYMHTLRAASGTTITDTITMHDTDAVTGPGTFTDIRVSDWNSLTIGRANRIVDTNVAGRVTLDAGTESTTISNVKFTGGARPIISIGAGSEAIVSKLCAPSGSTITGSGSLTYNGAATALPFTVTSSGCAISGNQVPMAPEGLAVD